MTDRRSGETTVEGFSALLEESRAALQRLHAGVLQSDDETENLMGYGASVDGRIQVSASIGGTIDKVDVDPRALRMGSEELGRQIAAATNAALTDLREKASAAAATKLTGYDHEQLSNQLLDIQDRSVRQMNAFAARMEDMLARTRRAAGTDGS